jgi:hypothetical protein
MEASSYNSLWQKKLEADAMIDNARAPLTITPDG